LYPSLSPIVLFGSTNTNMNLNNTAVPLSLLANACPSDDPYIIILFQTNKLPKATGPFAIAGRGAFLIWEKVACFSLRRLVVLHPGMHSAKFCGKGVLFKQNVVDGIHDAPVLQGRKIVSGKGSTATKANGAWENM
jgi:hypothetical protein